ncbi:dTDP-glucose 4,6-dehydratase, partial [mine drainage metagenome]
NCSNNYGPYHFPEKLIPLVIVNLLHGRELPVYGDGRNVRDWLHVSDHCRGIERVLEQGRAGEVYNIGGGAECENITLIETLCALADAAFEQRKDLARHFPDAPAARGEKTASLIRFVKDRPGHDRRYAIDCAKAERELGYRAEVTLEKGLARDLPMVSRQRGVVARRDGRQLPALDRDALPVARRAACANGVSDLCGLEGCEAAQGARPLRCRRANRYRGSSASASERAVSRRSPIRSSASMSACRRDVWTACGTSPKRRASCRSTSSARP